MMSLSLWTAATPRRWLSIEEEDETTEQEEATHALVILGIVLFLIGVTLIFEHAKEHLQEHTNRHYKVILEKLFEEMTVLGFLSMCTFLLTQMEVFQSLGDKYYGSSEELLEVFEQVHFVLFFIMIGFVMQVLVLVREATETEQNWIQMDAQCRTLSDRQCQTVLREQQTQSAWWRLWTLLPLMRNVSTEYQHDLVLFKEIRQEFILDRTVDPPFAASTHPVDAQQFNFGRYLSVCLGSTLAHTVQVSHSSWLFFGLGTIFFVAVHFLLDFDATDLAWMWVSCGWLFFVFEVGFEYHLLWIRDQFVVGLSSMDDQAENGETQTATPSEERSLLSRNHLPSWTNIDLRDFIRRRSWLSSKLIGSSPNRQEALYFCDRKGPKIYLHVLQIKLLFVGIYVAVHVLEFLTAMRTQHSLSVFVLYCVLAALPILGIVFNAKHLVSTLSLVCCLGIYRRPQVIASVLREHKTISAVRTLICIYKLRRFAQQAGNLHRHYTESPHRPHLSHSESFSALEMAEVGKTFDGFDTDQSGSITADEIHQLMLSLDAPIMPSTLGTILRRLDRDGDGEISRDEFLQWYSETMQEEDELSERERAEFLFDLFDKNKSGEISIGEFQHKLDSLNAGFTVDEIGAIVNELDEDNSGSVGVEEFEHLLHKYYPRELSALHDASTRSGRSSRSQRHDHDSHH